MIDSQPIYSHSQQERDDPRDSFVPTESDDSETVKEPETPQSDDSSLELPEPDADNITVLTSKLPNKPILPWNRYDSPWKRADESEIKELDQKLSESIADLDPSHPINEDDAQSLKSEEEE